MTKFVTRPKRILAALAMGGLLLAACGGDDDGDTSADTSTTTASASITTAAGERADGTRTVDSVNGPIEVPADPQRIVVTGYNETEDLLALGLAPIAVAYEPPSFYPQFEYERITNEAFEIQLEQIVALEPDLIIGVEWSTQALYDQLSAIAPTVVFPTTKFAAWQEMFLATAEVVGKTSEAQTMIDEFDARLQTAGGDYGDVIDGRTMNFFRPLTGGGTALQLMGNGEFHDFFFDALGIVHSDAVESGTSPEGDSRIEASPEQIELLDADVLFRGRFGVRDGSGDIVATDDAQIAANHYADELAEGPLWRNLGVVARGGVVDVPVEHWNEGRIIAAGLVLDDILATLEQLRAAS